jgi:acetylornithine deacetylase
MFSCDLFAFTRYGNMPAAVFGPAGEKLHGPDEWVSINSMETVTIALHDFLIEWCGG